MTERDKSHIKQGPTHDWWLSPLAIREIMGQFERHIGACGINGGDISSFQKVSSHVIGKIETFIEDDSRYKKHCTQDDDASVPFEADTLGLYTVLPVAISCPTVLSWISMMVWNPFPFKGDFSLGKSQKLQGTKSGLYGAESPEWFDVSPKTLHKTWCVSRCVAVMKLPVTSCP